MTTDGDDTRDVMHTFTLKRNIFPCAITGLFSCAITGTTQLHCTTVQSSLSNTNQLAITERGREKTNNRKKLGKNCAVCCCTCVPHHPHPNHGQTTHERHEFGSNRAGKKINASVNPRKQLERGDIREGDRPINQGSLASISPRFHR